MSGELIFAAIVLGTITSVVAQFRGRNGFAWFLLGTLFPAFALLVVAVMPKENSDSSPTPDSHVKCPDCKELVLKEAVVCKHCKCKLVPQP
jgi:hypothetical protein